MNPRLHPSVRSSLPVSRLAALALLAAGLMALPGRAQTAAPAPTADATPPPAESTPTPADMDADKIVRLDTFTAVSTSIGTYHEESSAMATKVPTDMKEIASSLQVLNASAIGDRNAQTLPDIFSYVVGATQSQNAVNGFSFRGFPNTGTFTQNIQFDGLMGATLKKGASSSADVDNLQFLKGPNSVLYGQMNPGGLLNIVTKSPLETQQGSLRLTVATYAGNYSSFGSKVLTEDSLDLTGPIDRAGHLLYRLVIDASSSPPSRPQDYDKYLSIYPSLTFKFNADTSFTIKMESSQDRRRQDDGLVPIFTQGTDFGQAARYTTAPFNTVYEDPTDVARDRGVSLSTFFKTVIAQDWIVRVQTRSVWHTDYTRELTVNNAAVYLPKATYATPTTTLTRQYNLQINGHRYNFFDANVYRVFGNDKFKDTVLVGVGGGEEFSNNSRWAFGPNVLPAITLYNPILGQSAYPADKLTQSARQTTTSLGEYFSDQLVLFQRLHLSGGVRNDQNFSHGIDPFFPTATPYSSQHVKSTTGQAGIVFDVTNTLSAYGSWSQSVVPNSITALDASGHNSFPPGTGLQYEGGLKFASVDRTIFGTFAAYYIDRSNVLVATTTTVTVPGPTFGKAIFRLDGDQHSEGVEFEGQWQPKKYWQMSTGVALGKAFVASSIANPRSVGEDLIAAPRGSGNFWTRFNVPDGIFKGLGWGTGIIYVGKTWSGDLTSIYYVLPGYTRVDSALYYTWKRFSFSLNVKNLFDRRYINSAQSNITLNPGELRTVTFSATTKF
jgi:iron complex outermembrane receptor protein